MIKTCISGFQTGVDIAGIKIAKELGIETGGWIPKGFRTLNGSKPEYAELYNAKEHSSYKYPPRTFLNVRDSDATLRFAIDFNSTGERCTKKAIDYYNKPYADILISDVNKFEVDTNDSPEEIAKWIFYYEFKILNIAGNSEKTAPGIEKWVYRYLKEMFKELKIMEESNG